MIVDWLREPVTQIAILSGILGIGLLGSLMLWISVKIRARASESVFKAFRISTETAIRELTARLDGDKSALGPDPTPSTVLEIQSLNLTNRTKALRMNQRGESIAAIAECLGVQQGEIELLLKLERLLEATAA